MGDFNSDALPSIGVPNPLPTNGAGSNQPPVEGWQIPQPYSWGSDWWPPVYPW